MPTGPATPGLQDGADGGAEEYCHLALRIFQLDTLVQWHSSARWASTLLQCLADQTMEEQMQFGTHLQHCKCPTYRCDENVPFCSPMDEANLKLMEYDGPGGARRLISWTELAYGAYLRLRKPMLTRNLEPKMMPMIIPRIGLIWWNLEAISELSSDDFDDQTYLIAISATI